MRLVGYAIAALALIAALAFAPTRDLVTEIDIDAPPADVWAVLTDGDAYGEWNPFIVEMRGPVEVGGTLQNTLQPSPDQQMSFAPTILVVEEERELRWLGRLWVPRLFDGEHYFLLSETDGGTRLVHGERFSGVLLWFIDVEDFRANFEAMNAALKERAEGRAAAGGD